MLLASQRKETNEDSSLLGLSRAEKVHLLAYLKR